MNEQLAKLPDVGTGYDEPRAITPLSLIEMAVGQGADIEKLSKLLDLQMRWEANEARKGFVGAMNRFKADMPEISKNHHVEFTNSKGTVTKYDHATLDHACDVLIPALSKYGLHHRWKIAQDAGKIRVTCIITHELGHSEETTMEASPDDSGGKNPIQAISSSTSYLERYTFLAAIGTAAKGLDDDGRGHVAEMETLQVHLDRIKGSENVQQLTNAFRDAFAEATKLNNVKAGQAIMKAKDETKARLQKAEAGDAKVSA